MDFYWYYNVLNHVLRAEGSKILKYMFVKNAKDKT